MHSRLDSYSEIYSWYFENSSTTIQREKEAEKELTGIAINADDNQMEN